MFSFRCILAAVLDRQIQSVLAGNCWVFLTSLNAAGGHIGETCILHDALADILRKPEILLGCFPMSTTLIDNSFRKIIGVNLHLGKALHTAVLEREYTHMDHNCLGTSSLLIFLLAVLGTQVLVLLDRCMV